MALYLGAIMGGTPGYRTLIDTPLPTSPKKLPSWLATNVLNPAHALFHELGYLLREDPRIHDKALYNSILCAIADGATTASKIGSTAGFVRRDEDVLLGRRPIYRIADPIVRFSQLIIEPYRVLLEEGHANEAWAAAAASFSSGVLGPYFEHVAVRWSAVYAGDRWPARSAR